MSDDRDVADVAALLFRHRPVSVAALPGRRGSREKRPTGDPVDDPHHSRGLKRRTIPRCAERAQPAGEGPLEEGGMGHDRGAAPEGQAGPRRGATDEQVRRALRFVPAVARRYRGLGLSLDELVAAGNLGVVEAATRFDPSRNVSFGAYAEWWIRKAVLEAVEEQAGPLRLPRYQWDWIRRLQRMRADWVQHHNEEPDAERLSAAAGLPVAEVVRLIRYARSGVSLDEPTSAGNERPLKDLLADASQEGPLRLLIRAELTSRLERRVHQLDARKRDVLRKRFGLGGQPPLTLRQAARELGVSRERVRQIEVRALLELRNLL
jgi:RNA polymerase primary sigma factor